MSKLAKALTAAAGNAAGESLYVEDVFSTYLYTGDGTNPHVITNGINLADEGGLIWTKARDSGSIGNIWVDTERGTGFLESNSTQAASGVGTAYLSFNTDGYDIDNAFNNWNGITIGDYASWTFRKAEKFFDVVTYTGSAATQNIAHNLGSTPGMIIIKRTDTGPSDWIVYHQGLNNGTDPEDYYLILNGAASENNAWIFNKTAPTDTTFTVGGGTGNVNTSGGTYVAYLFASDAGGFGDDGSESIIKCGSYTGNGGTQEINLGFEPQWVLIKRTSATDYYGWQLYDIMRGMPVGSADAYLRANLSSSELSYDDVDPTATGMIVKSGSGGANASSADYIYIAIRRPMKTPESGTEVFAVADDRLSPLPGFVSGFPVDFALRKYLSGTSRFEASARLMQGKKLNTATTDAEETDSSQAFDYMDGWYSAGNSGWFSWMFKRATGFFDVVAYTGDGVAGRTVAHNLAVVPEMMIVKRRNNTGNWTVYDASYGGQYYLRVNTDAAAALSSTIWNDTDPTSSVFTLGAGVNVNGSGSTYIAYLFATLAGVSKVFSVTKSSGSNANVDCGFSAGARFILLKRTDSTGDWYVWDSVRGIVSGNDPYLLLNSTAAEVTTTDHIDPLASGFTIVDGGLANGDYIGLAIA